MFYNCFLVNNYIIIDNEYVHFVDSAERGDWQRERRDAGWFLKNFVVKNCGLDDNGGLVARGWSGWFLVIGLRGNGGRFSKTGWEKLSLGQHMGEAPGKKGVEDGCSQYG